MSCITGCLRFRKVYKDMTGSRLTVNTFTLPGDQDKILFYRNGQLVPPGDPEGYVISGNGFDLAHDMKDWETFQVVVLS